MNGVSRSRRGAEMGHYLDLIRETAHPEPSQDPDRDQSDISDIRGVRSLLSLMSQRENRATKGLDFEPELKIGLPEAALLDAQWWRTEYAERAAHREYDGGHRCAEAELLAWRALENRWNLAHGERVPRELCAGCRRPIGTEAALNLIDGNHVHDRAGHECLIRHGERWHAAATRALIAMGLQPPVGEDAFP